MCPLLFDELLLVGPVHAVAGRARLVAPSLFCKRKSMLLHRSKT
jgi:hypothetical protein